MNGLRAPAIRFWAKSAAVSSSVLLLARVAAGCAGLAAAPSPSVADAAATSTEDAISPVWAHVDSSSIVDSTSQQEAGAQSDGGAGFMPEACTTADGSDDAGPITIRGHVRNPSGVPVVGAQVELSGALQARGSTDFTGGFTFHVSAGSYTLTLSGACGPASSTGTLDDLASNASPELTATGTACVTSTPSNVVSSGEVLHLAEGDAGAGWTAVNVGQLCTPGDTTCCTAQLDVSELQQIAAGHPSSPPRWLTIAGYPALEQQVTFTTPLPLCPAPCAVGFVPATILAVTTTIAAGRTLVSFGTQIQADASADAVALIVTAGESFTPEEIPELAGPPPDE